MNPADPASFNHRTERLSTGRTYHFVDQMPVGYRDHASAPTILCVHGFPDIWYGWRHVIGPWVRAGYRVIVPDMLGYGGTDKPQAAEEYSTKKLCADLAALLNLVGVPKAIVVGHDWGSYTAGRFALWQPDRLLALALLSVPFAPPTKKYIPLENVVKKVPNYSYQLYFASEEATKEIEVNFERFMRLMYGFDKPKKNFAVDNNLREAIVNSGSVVPTNKGDMTQAELQYVASQMGKMNGPLSYYRTSKIRFEEEQAAGLPEYPSPDLPVLHIWGEKDATSTPGMLAKIREGIPQLQEIKLPNARHWVMLHAKEEVVAGVLDWLSGLNIPRPIRAKL
ncbi:alpha/beta-hydrolase [Gloeopeniophorella convolvens]|nr:alpha/beta-hydrolase [Gloeopeniophorella convolvens]